MSIVSTIIEVVKTIVDIVKNSKIVYILHSHHLLRWWFYVYLFSARLNTFNHPTFTSLHYWITFQNKLL